MGQERVTSDSAGQPIGTVARAVHVFAAVVDTGRPVSVSTVAKKTGLPPSTTHRLLGLLMQEGMVKQEGDLQAYSVGAEGYRIAARTLATVDLPRMVRPILEELAARFDETVIFGLYSHATSSVSFVSRADGNHVLQYRIELNKPTALLWGASGKSVAAYLTESELDQAYESERQKGAAGGSANGMTLPDPAVLKQELAGIRRRGYVETQGEKLPGAHGVAVPVFSPEGVVGSITLTHPKERPPHGEASEILDALKNASRRIGEFFGAPHQEETKNG